MVQALTSLNPKMPTKKPAKASRNVVMPNRNVANARPAQTSPKQIPIPTLSLPPALNLSPGPAPTLAPPSPMARGPLPLSPMIGTSPARFTPRTGMSPAQLTPKVKSRHPMSVSPTVALGSGSGAPSGSLEPPSSKGGDQTPSQWIAVLTMESPSRLFPGVDIVLWRFLNHLRIRNEVHCTASFLFSADVSSQDIKLLVDGPYPIKR